MVDFLLYLILPSLLPKTFIADGVQTEDPTNLSQTLVYKSLQFTQDKFSSSPDLWAIKKYWFKP